MDEVTGKTLKFMWGNPLDEIRAKAVNVSHAFDVIDTTNTTTPGGGMESVVGRVRREITVEAHLRDGTGKKVTGKTLAITIDGVPYKGRTIDYDVAYTELDGTDTGVPAPNKEVALGRFKTTSAITAIMYRSTALQIENSAPDYKDVIITFADGITITGQARFHQQNVSAEVNGAVAVDYSLEWSGAPVEVGLDLLPLDDQQPAEVIYEEGSVSNAELVGEAIFMTKSIRASAMEDVTMSYTGIFQGDVTPDVYEES